MENFKVYVHINKNNNKAYVGMTKQNPEYRWGSQGQGYRVQPKFYNAIQKYGWNNFEHLILADNIKSEEEALEIESYYIEIYDSIENGYNILPKGIVSYPRSKPVFCITTQTKYNSIKEAAEKTGCLPTAIIENCKGLKNEIPVESLLQSFSEYKASELLCHSASLLIFFSCCASL